MLSCRYIVGIALLLVVQSPSPASSEFNYELPPAEVRVTVRGDSLVAAQLLPLLDRQFYSLPRAHVVADTVRPHLFLHIVVRKLQQASGSSVVAAAVTVTVPCDSVDTGPSTLLKPRPRYSSGEALLGQASYLQEASKLERVAYEIVADFHDAYLLTRQR